MKRTSNYLGALVRVELQIQTSVLLLHDLKQGDSESSLIIITASIINPELLWLSMLLATPVPILSCSLEEKWSYNC